ncbi:MAG: DedA family protein [Paludibacteraceae bacterium]|nr:DedA family protein [Paludibacteraceae bacterium]
MDFLAEYGLWGMFIAAFLAGTIIPVPSEGVMTALIFAGANKWHLVWTAIAGNTIGEMTCYWLGYMGKTEWLEKYYKIDHTKVEKAKVWVDKYGVWLGLISWVPVLGNIIVVTLGYMKVSQWKVWMTVLLGKTIRYVSWMYISVYSISLFN